MHCITVGIEIINWTYSDTDLPPLQDLGLFSSFVKILRATLQQEKIVGSV